MDLGGISILGWTPGDSMPAAAVAVLIGVVLAVGLLAFMRKATRLMLVLLVAVAIGAWAWLR